MSALAQMRRYKDISFAQDPYSPIPTEDRVGFNGLNYYPKNDALVFRLKIEEFVDKNEMTMQTSTGEIATFYRFGQIHFLVKGEMQTLTVYQSPANPELFLPFKDASNGTETYGAGRYMELHPLGDGDYEVDFNQAYNPYCAYSDQWSCPIPPPENRLEVAIEAGEKAYKANGL